MMQNQVLLDAEDDGSEGVHFRLIFAATFIAMVVAGCIAHVLPWRIRPRRGDDTSIFRRAKEKARHYSAFAFMG